MYIIKRKDLLNEAKLEELIKAGKADQLLELGYIVLEEEKPKKKKTKSDS